MRDRHLTPETLRHLLENGQDEEANRLLLHHLAVCPACYAIGGYVLDLYTAGRLPLPFCTLDVDLEASRTGAPALLLELHNFSPGRQREVISEESRFRSWGLAELLCKESERLAGEDPPAANHAAELAVAVAASLKEWEPAEATWLSELRALTWAHVANALRVAGDLRGAEKAWLTADRLWEEGYLDAGDILGYEALFLALKASLRRAKRQLPEALALLDRARAAEPDRRLSAIIVVNRAKVLEESGDVAGAIAELAAGAAAVEAADDRRLSFVRRHNLLDLLSKTGRIADAAAILPEVKERAERDAMPSDLIRIRWIEARLQGLSGEVEGALALFAEVEARFLELDMGYEVALVMLERTLLLLEVGRAGEVRPLAERLVPLFQSRDVHREALAAVTIFDQAVREESVGVVLAERLLAFLRASRANRFEAGRDDGTQEPA